MLGVDDVASRFIRARRARVQEILERLYRAWSDSQE
jgi:hypothetical protein